MVIARWHIALCVAACECKMNVYVWAQKRSHRPVPITKRRTHVCASSHYNQSGAARIYKNCSNSPLEGDTLEKMKKSSAALALSSQSRAVIPRGIVHRRVSEQRFLWHLPASEIPKRNLWRIVKWNIICFCVSYECIIFYACFILDTQA